MELAALLFLVLLHLAAAVGLYRAGHRVLTAKLRAPIRAVMLLALSLAVTAGCILTSFLALLLIIKGCLAWHAGAGPAACENLSPMHLVFVFTLGLPLLSAGQAALFAAGLPRKKS